MRWIKLPVWLEKDGVRVRMLAAAIGDVRDPEPLGRGSPAIIGRAWVKNLGGNPLWLTGEGGKSLVNQW